MRYIHTSHKTAAKKLEKVKWTEDLTPEEIAQSDENIAQACDVVREVCGRKKIGDCLTRYAFGLVLCYPDKGTGDCRKDWKDEEERVLRGGFWREDG